MTKESLWQLLLSRNPKLETGGAMTPQGYRKMFDLVWDQSAEATLAAISRSDNHDMPEFLKGLFKCPPHP
jgi:hypothetical protein